MGDQVRIYPYQRNGRQEDMILDAGSIRRIEKRTNHVKFGKQLCRAQLSLAMSPTYLHDKVGMGFIGYGQ